MAKQEKKAEKQQEIPQEKAGQQSGSGGLMQWAVMAVIVVVCAAAGFFLARIFAGMRGTEPVEATPNESAPIEELLSSKPAASADEVWYYDMEPVVANLDEPGVRRYVRATLTLAVSVELDQKKGQAFLEDKKPLLVDWLTIYLASLKLDDIRGERNLRRIQTQVLDMFNERLFPDSKGFIRKVLFKEFAVQ